MSATAEQIITALYAGFFNSTPDAVELNNYIGQTAGGHDLATFNALADKFSKHPKYHQVYGLMSNQEFVETIYINSFGCQGNSHSISHWVADLDAGMSRTNFVSTLVYSILDVDLSDNSPGLNPEQIKAAKNQQNTLFTKTNACITFIHAYTRKSYIRHRNG